MPQLDEKVIDALQASNAAIVRYEQAWQEKQAQEARAAALIPNVVSTLVRYGRIEPHETKEAAEALKDPAQALELMKKLAAHRSPAEETALGQQVDSTGRAVTGQTKKASDRFAGGGFVGLRTAEKPESWNQFERQIGLAG